MLDSVLDSVLRCPFAIARCAGQCAGQSVLQGVLRCPKLSLPIPILAQSAKLRFFKVAFIFSFGGLRATYATAVKNGKLHKTAAPAGKNKRNF